MFFIEKLKNQAHRDSTKDTYYKVWKQFGKFYLRLDYKPVRWEDKIVLFIGHLINENKQSSTIKSYLSAIRAVLKTSGIQLNEDRFLVNSLTRACKLKNDEFRTRLPIHRKMLAVILKQTRAYFKKKNQPYLALLYQTLFSIAYFGLFRVGELTSGSHPIKAGDIKVGRNKRKMKFILRSSKTHGRYNCPQLVKISSQDKSDKQGQNSRRKYISLPCPYQLLRDYAAARGPMANPKNDPFFVFAGGIPVKPAQMRGCLKLMIKKAGYDKKLFSVHSFRMGRSEDLLKLGLSVETIKKLGRWKSNAIFKYLRYA